MIVRAALSVLACSLLLAGCSGRYMGIDRESLPANLLTLHDRASLGDAQAQYELGMVYERGEGVPRDCDRARSLLRDAASASGGTIWVYSPPVGNGTSGRVIPVDQGPVRPGLATARETLEDPEFCNAG